MSDPVVASCLLQQGCSSDPLCANTRPSVSSEGAQGRDHAVKYGWEDERAFL